MYQGRFSANAGAAADCQLRAVMLLDEAARDRAEFVVVQRVVILRRAGGIIIVGLRSQFREARAVERGGATQVRHTMALRR